MEFLKNGTEHVTQGKPLYSTIEENSEIVDRNESTIERKTSTQKKWYRIINTEPYPNEITDLQQRQQQQR